MCWTDPNAPIGYSKTPDGHIELTVRRRHARQEIFQWCQENLEHGAIDYNSMFMITGDNMLIGFYTIADMQKYRTKWLENLPFRTDSQRLHRMFAVDPETTISDLFL